MDNRYLAMLMELEAAKCTVPPKVIGGPIARPTAPDLRWTLREVLGFRASLLVDLPEPVTLLINLEGFGELRISTLNPEPRERVQIAQRFTPTLSSTPVFFGAEWTAVVDAAEQDRVWPHQLREWCSKKRQRPTWELTPTYAMGATLHDHEPPKHWTVDQLLRRLGAELLSIEVGDV